MSWSLGISPCPNDTFAFHALVAGLVPGAPQVRPTYADIDVLNARAARGDFDLVKVSYGALPWLLEDYRLLPTGGALGRGCGPLVVTRPGRTGLAGASVAVPGDRTTAYLLLRLWGAEAGLGAVRVLPFDEIMPAVAAGTVDAGLIIHESRFTYPDHGLVAVADLGQWWEEQTDLPIPLGAILVRRSLGEDAAFTAEVAVRASVELARSDPAATRDYVLAHAQEMATDVVAAHIELYVNEYTVALGESGYAAVHELLARAAAAGLVPPTPAELLG